jgi:mono/diheme cytochrome c family protein
LETLMPDSPRPERRLRFFGPALAVLVALAMGAPASGPGTTIDRTGERIFFSRDETPVRIACADCHLVTAPGMTPPDDLIRPGHTLFDAFGRGNWWNGQVTTDCGEAGERCLKRFMGGDQMSGKTRTSLVLYMKSLGAPVSNPLVIRRMPPGQVEVSAGDPLRGRDLFRRTCEMCHPGGGAGLGPDLRSSEMTLHQIADLIRTGSDPMPFYQLDILSNEQVADIAAATYALRPGPE